MRLVVISLRPILCEVEALKLGRALSCCKRIQVAAVLFPGL